MEGLGNQIRVNASSEATLVLALSYVCPRNRLLHTPTSAWDFAPFNLDIYSFCNKLIYLPYRGTQASLVPVSYNWYIRHCSHIYLKVAVDTLVTTTVSFSKLSI